MTTLVPVLLQLSGKFGIIFCVMPSARPTYSLWWWRILLTRSP